MMTLGDKIACYRKNMNITQDALAQQLGVTNQAVSKWESDQCCPDVMLLPKIADIFSVSLDELFGRESSQKRSALDPQWPDDNILRVLMYVGNRLVGSGPIKEGYQYTYEGTVDGVISCTGIACGDVMGNVDAGQSVSCGNVYGSVDAGTDVRCGDVYGSVDAGLNITCGNVGGDVDAGCMVECGNVEGSIDANGPVTIRK
jgi:DNA-binding XRE family transcriptional regulator